MMVIKEPLKTISTELIMQLEQIESNNWLGYYATGSPLKLFTSRIGGGRAYAAPEVNMLAMNKVLGAGINQPITKKTLSRLIDFYQKVGSQRFFVQLPPQVVSGEVKQLLIESGFIHYNDWTKLYRSISQLDVYTNPELTIESIDLSDAELYGRLITTCFEWEDNRLPLWLSKTVGNKCYKHYLVKHNSKAIAAGALFLDGQFASMAIAGTLEGYRGVGAQTLLLKTRMDDAQRAGAKFIASETARHCPDKEVKSFMNMARLGFSTAYHRQNWLFVF